jgi:hypothetical protein
MEGTMSIKVFNGNLQADQRRFAGQIDIDASDGDADTNRLFDLLEALFKKAMTGAIVIDVSPNEP